MSPLLGTVNITVRASTDLELMIYNSICRYVDYPQPGRVTLPC